MHTKIVRDKCTNNPSELFPEILLLIIIKFYYSFIKHKRQTENNTLLPVAEDVRDRDLCCQLSLRLFIECFILRGNE